MKKWSHRINFVADWERKYNDDTVSLQEMCDGILNSFYTESWISTKPGSNDEFQKVSKVGIPAYEMDELEELVYGELHTIAYQDEIFGEDEELPNVNDYDYWKNGLYAWCDKNNVWLEPTGW